MYVTPGLIDLHTHNYTGTGERNSYAGDISIRPDGFTFRTGVTTVIDAGCAGWRNFEDFKDRIIDRSKTRILAMLNIVGAGMRGGKYESNTFDMDGEATAKMAARYPGLIIGIKTAHFEGPGMDSGGAGGRSPAPRANIPVMVDFGADRPTRPLYDLLTKKLAARATSIPICIPACARNRIRHQGTAARA
jgi:dihydroorotase